MARRHAHVDWSPPETDAGGLQTWDGVRLSVLMDIRDHLKAIRQIFECANAQRIPAVLDRIARNTSKPKVKKGDG